MSHTLKDLINGLDYRRLMKSLQGQTAAGRYKGFPIHFFKSEEEHAAMGGYDFDYQGPGYYYESRVYPGITLLFSGYRLSDVKNQH